MELTESPLPAASVGMIIRKVVELEDGRGLLIYPMDGEPLTITPQHELWGLVMGAHTATVDLAKDKAEAKAHKPSLWNRLVSYVAEKWAKMRGAPQQQSERQFAPRSIPLPAKQQPSLVPEAGRSPLPADKSLQTEPGRDQAKAPASVEKPAAVPAKEKGSDKPEKDEPVSGEKKKTEKVLFNGIEWDKERGFTATLGDGKRIEIGKKGPAADQFHEMMGGLAKMIREVHAEKEKLGHQKGAEKSAEKEEERRPKLRLAKEKESAPENESSPVGADRDPNDEKEVAEKAAQIEREVTEQAREHESVEAAAPENDKSDAGVSATEIAAAVSAANRTIDDTVVGHENAVFTPIIYDDERDTLFVVRAFVGGKETFYRATIAPAEMQNFVDKFQGAESKIPMLGRVEEKDGKPELVSMYSTDTYGKQPPSKTIEAITGAPTLALEKIEDPQAALGEDTKIFERMARVTASIIQRETPAPAQDTPTPSSGKNEPIKEQAIEKSPSKSADDINAELAQAAQPQEPGMEEQISSPAPKSVSLEPVSNIAERATEPTRALFSDYRKDKGQDRQK